MFEIKSNAWECLQYGNCFRFNVNINTLIQELGSTKTKERTSQMRSLSSITIVVIYVTTKFAVGISENQEKIPTLYWLPKLLNDHINQVLLQTPVHARLLNCLNC